ncbi:MAG TPA: efflux RND transporter periplasmic adaptor subunit [Dongiaceae bacterium]|nr:efflux RND transporter periplasmic adaptor subunit [Dongiaceae bacterium]
MKKVAYVVAALLIVAGLFWLSSRPEIPKVKVATLDQGAVESLVANTRAGTIRSCQRSKLSLQSGGTVSELLVKNGDRVEKGQVLLRLWNGDQRARLNQARAQLDAANLAVREICGNAARDQRDAKRAETLAKKNVISDDALDTSRTRAEVASHTCERTKVETSAAQAQLELQEALLQQTELLAPFAGVVAEINGEVGEFVTPSPPGVATPPAVDLIADDCLYVRAPIDEVDAAAIKVGMPARLTLDAFRGQTFTGTVTRIAPYVQDFEKQARTVDVEAHFDQPPENVQLLVGYSADIEVILSHRDKTLRAPTEAVFDGNQVLVLNANNILEKRTFEPGLANWTWTEVKSGLQAGDRVLLTLDVPGAEAGAEVAINSEKTADSAKAADTGKATTP